MDPVRNPYAPGAGSPPPELAGRDEILETVRIATARIQIGRPAKSFLLIGLRGVGKTVLLDRMRSNAEAEGVLAIRLEAPEELSLPALIAPQVRMALLTLSKTQNAKELAQRALRALAGFAKALKVEYMDISVGFDFDPEPGLADNGNLEQDLAALLEATGRAAKEAGRAIVLFIDELQYVKEDQLAALITALHRCAQLSLPVILIGAGLPQLRGRLGNAKSYSERLFDFKEIGPLTQEAARTAIELPAREEGVAFEETALANLVQNSSGYPYFIQAWGKEVWDVADESPITLDDVVTATASVLQSLDQGFFRVRFDRLTPVEKRYMRAMAELGQGPHRSGDIAQILGKEVQQLGPIRSAIIAKGMIWSPSHGDTAFTVPLFDEFMRRIMPGDDWKQ